MSPTPLRILAVTDFYLPRAGGVERVVHETARRLQGLGVAVEVLTRRLTRDASAREEIDGVPVHRVGSGPGPLVLERLRLGRAVRAWARRELGRFDLVHAHLTLTALPLVAECRRRGLPLIATFYGPWHREYLEEMAAPGVPSRWPGPLRAWVRPFIAGWLFRMQRSVLQGARRVVVLSEHSRKELAELGFAVQAPIVRVPGGVDVERFRPRDREQARARVPALSGAGRPLLVAVRRLVPRMGLLALLDAVHRIRPSYPGLTLALAGAGPLAGDLDAEARRLGLGSGFLRLGQVPEEQLPWLYAAADLTVLPTRALEGFGLPVLESWASGVAVVATRAGSLEELVGSLGEEWLSDGTDGEALAAALGRALPLAAAPGVGERVRAWAMSHRWETVSAELGGIYAQLGAGTAVAGKSGMRS